MLCEALTLSTRTTFLDGVFGNGRAARDPTAEHESSKVGRLALAHNVGTTLFLPPAHSPPAHSPQLFGSELTPRRPSGVPLETLQLSKAHLKATHGGTDSSAYRSFQMPCGSRKLLFAPVSVPLGGSGARVLVPPKQVQLSSSSPSPLEKQSSQGGRVGRIAAKNLVQTEVQSRSRSF